MSEPSNTESGITSLLTAMRVADGEHSKFREEVRVALHDLDRDVEDMSKGILKVATDNEKLNNTLTTHLYGDSSTPGIVVRLDRAENAVKSMTTAVRFMAGVTVVQCAAIIGAIIIWKITGKP